MTFSKIIDKLKRDWSEPRHAIHEGKQSLSILSCTFSDKFLSKYKIVGSRKEKDRSASG